MTEAKTPYTYENGLPFSQKLAENMDDLIARVDGKKAAMLIIDGGVGEGKTTLAVQVADYVNSKHGQPEITLNVKGHPQLGLGGAEFMKQLRICYHAGYVIIIYDEAGDFNRRGALTRFNAMLNRVFETYRGFKIIVILCLPSFHVLDKDLFDKNIPRLLLHLDSRTMKAGNFKGYSLYRMMYIQEKMKKLVVKSFAYDLERSNFRGHFLDLPPERCKKLDKLSTEGKLKTLKDAEIKIEGLLSYSDLAKKLTRSVVWVRMAVGKLKIKQKRTINRLKYFDELALNALAEHLDETGRGK